MTDPRRDALDYLAALTDGEYAALALEARDPRRRTQASLSAINGQLRQVMARTDRNGRIIEGTD